MTAPLAVNANLLSYINTYANIATVSAYGNVLASANAQVAANNFSSNNENALGNIVCTYQPLLNQVTDSASGLKTQFTTLLLNHVNTILPSDYTIFIQLFNISSSYCQQINNFTSSATVVKNYLGSTFVNINSLTTGGFSQVSTNLNSFGSDLFKTGYTINFANLGQLGLPSQLLKNIRAQAQGFIVVDEELKALNVPDTIIANLKRANFKPALNVEKAIFVAMTKITGARLTQVLSILKCTTTNITVMAQLLDPKYLFPTSYKTLLSPTSAGFANIYNDNGSVNDVFTTVKVNTFKAQLLVVTNSDLASSNTALSQSLLQIKTLSDKTAIEIGPIIQSLQSTTSLPLVNAQTNPLNPDAANIYKYTDPGTGADGTLIIGDVIGSVAGYGLNDNWTLVNNGLSNIISANLAWTLTNSGNGLFPVMVQTLNGAYGPATGPITGLPSGPWSAGEPFANLDAAFDDTTYGLIKVGTTQIANVVAAITTSSSGNKNLSNNAWNNMYQKVVSENVSLAKIPIDIANDITHGGTETCMSWMQSFKDYALDTQTGGAVTVIRGVIDISTLPGQTIEGTIIEQQNLAKLRAAGLYNDNEIGTTTPLMINSAAYLAGPPTSLSPGSGSSAPVPSIDSISPTAGTIRGGTGVKIFGNNFTGASSVKFGTNNANSVSVVSDNQIYCETPAGTAASGVSVSVTTSAGTGSASLWTYQTNNQAPIISRIDPPSGDPTLPAPIRIYGENLISVSTDNLAAVKVSFNGVAGTIVNPPLGTPNPTPPDYIEVIPPAGAKGQLVTVTVQTLSGTTTFNSWKYSGG